MEWGLHRGGANCRPIGVWAIGDEEDLQCGFLRGCEERAAVAERIRRRLVAAGERLDPQAVFTEDALEIADATSYCGPIAHTEAHTTTTGCVQSLLSLLEKQWDNKKMRWRSGLKMPLERYKMGAEERE